MSGRPLTLARRESRDGRLLVAPTLLVVALVVIAPFLGILWFAFQGLRLIDIPRLSLIDIPRLSLLDFEPTLEHFEEVFTRSGFWTVFRTTVLYATFCTITSIGAGALGEFGLGRFMANSLVVAVGTTILSVGFSALGAYAAVRLRFFGRDAVNGFFLGIYVPPAIVLAVPLFVMFSRIGLRGTLPGLIIIYLAQTIPLALYMLRNYFHAVPASVEEAAMIDGCGRLGLIRRVVLPIATPGLAATGLYVFMIAWNEFLFALLFLVDTRERWTVSLGLAQFDQVGVPVTVLMAGSIVITLPVVVLFFLAERMLVAGLTAGAEKG